MVGPAAKREAVAHLQAVMGLSERRACSIVGADRKMIRYRSCRPRRQSCAAGFATLPTSGDASAIGGCSSSFVGRASRRGSTASIGSTVKKA